MKAALRRRWLVLGLLAAGAALFAAEPPTQRPVTEPGLDYRDAEGTLGRGALVFHDASYTLADGTILQFGRLEVDAHRRSLFHREVDITSVAARDVDIWLPPEQTPKAGDEPLIPERIPWPDITLPIDLDLRSAELRNIRIHAGDGSVMYALERLDTAFDWPRGGAITIDRLDARGAFGELDAHGRLTLAGTPSADLTLALRRSGQREPLTARVQPAGDGALAIALQLPGSGTVEATVSPQLDWQLSAHLQDFQPGDWLPTAPDAEPGPPLDIELSAHGTRERAQLSGHLVRGDRDVEIGESTIAIEPRTGALTLQPLTVATYDGSELTVTGRVVPGDPLQLDLNADAAPLVLALGDGVPARYRGRIEAHGTPDDLALKLDGRLAREDLEAAVALDGRLTGDTLTIDALQLAQAAGQLAATGTVGWQPAPHWQLDATLTAFDPGVFAEALAGRVDGTLHTRGELTDAGLGLDLDIERLTGQLRERALNAHGTLQLRPDGSGQADLMARLGDSRLRITGEPDQRRDLDAALEHVQLSDLVPGAEGVVTGHLRLLGVDAPTISGQLHGEGLTWQDLAAARAELSFATPLSLDGDGHATIALTNALLRGEPIAELSLELAGGLPKFSGDLALTSPRLALGSHFSGGRDGDVWRIELATLRAQPDRLPEFTLAHPAQIRIAPDAFEIGRNCLTSGDAGICFSAEQQGERQRISAELQALPLALAEPWLVQADAPLRVEGRLDGTATLLLLDGTPIAGQVELRSAAGQLQWLREPVQQLVQWQQLGIDGTLADGRLQLTLGAGIDENGRLEARLSGGSPFADGPQPLSGTVTLALPDVRLLSLLPETVVDPHGRLDARLQLAGTWARPDVAGDIELREFGAEIPALGITLANSSLAVSGDLAHLRVTGIAESAGQPLRVDGTVNGLIGDAPVTVEADIDGQRVLIADIPQARIIASPDLHAYYDGDKLRLTGSMTIPEATLALDQFDDTESLSDDVVVLDPRETREQDTALPVLADIEVTLGKKVDLKGFGFDGGLAGTLKVRERPGRPTTARGALTVRGEYTAYGQDLTIEHGQLLYAGTPIDDPALDVRVVREVRDVRVGLNIRGSARDPTTEVWSESDPAIDQGDALSLLLFGRPLNSAGAADKGQLTEAALAAGGNLLAARIGARLGFDTFEVANSDTLGGTAFTVGKYLSPRLQIRYGIALFGEGRALTLNYQINRKLELELEAGQENRAAINYKIER